MRTTSVDPVIQQLSRVPLFAGCSPRQLGALRRVTDVGFAPVGSLLLEEGSPVLWFFALARGTAVIAVDGEVVEELSAGCSFGEVALLGRQRAPFSVWATSPVELLCIGRREFLGAVDEIRPLSAALLRSLARPRPAAPAWLGVACPRPRPPRRRADRDQLAWPGVTGGVAGLA